MGLKAAPAVGGLIDADEIPLLVNDQGVPVAYADGVADVEIHPPNVRITFFEYVGEGADRVRRPCLQMIRPLASCQEPHVATLVARKLTRNGHAH